MKIVAMDFVGSIRIGTLIRAPYTDEQIYVSNSQALCRCLPHLAQIT